MVEALCEAEKAPVSAAAKKYWVSEQTIYACSHHFAGLAPSDVNKLRALEPKNAKLARVWLELQ